MSRYNRRDGPERNVNLSGIRRRYRTKFYFHTIETYNWPVCLLSFCGDQLANFVKRLAEPMVQHIERFVAGARDDFRQFTRIH